MRWSAKQLLDNFAAFYAAARLHHISHTPVPKCRGVTASPQGEAFRSIATPLQTGIGWFCAGYNGEVFSFFTCKIIVKLSIPSIAFCI